MKITSKGYTLSTLAENLQVFADRLKAVYGEDFVIKKEGAVDNVATSSSLSTMDLENQIAYVIKMLNPRTSEGAWQDFLYSIINLYRQQATYTVVTRVVAGSAGYTVEKGTLTIENKATKDQFVNMADTTIGQNGTALVSFRAIESGAIELDSDATINIVTPLDGVDSVYYTADCMEIVGVDYEDNAKFRERWELTSSLASANTEDGLYKALLGLVETKSDLSIIQNRTGSTVNGLAAHCMKIVINSPYDDNTIGQTILDHIVDGNQVGTKGSTAVTLTDSMGTPVTVRFQRAETVNIYVDVRIEVTDTTAMAQAQSDIKEAVMKYITENKFDMGSKIWANMFAGVIYSCDNINAISELKISTDGSTWADFIQLGSEQVPSFTSERIMVYEAS